MNIKNISFVIVFICSIMAACETYISHVIHPLVFCLSNVDSKPQFSKEKATRNFDSNFHFACETNWGCLSDESSSNISLLTSSIQANHNIFIYLHHNLLGSIITVILLRQY